MIDELRPYPEYKDSGLPWLGRIPESWRVVRIKTFLREVDDRTTTGREPLLSLRMRVGLVDHAAAGGKAITPSALIGYKRTTPGQIVMNRMRASSGLFAVTSSLGLVSPDYAVFHIGTEADAQYFVRLFKTPQMGRLFRAESTGLGTGESGFLRLYSDRFGTLPVPLPPQEEQRAIVRFLAAADRRVLRALNTKLALIARLEEQRRFIIRRAVTRGLNPGVRMKPSGAAWLGDVPAHWVLSRVRSEFECLNRRRIPLSGTERAAMKSRVFDYYGASGVIDKVDRYIFDEDLLLIAEDGANLVLRNLPLAVIARGKFWVNNHAHILRPRKGHIEFLAAVMEQINYLPWISGAAQPKLTRDRLMGISIAVPSRDEQDQIVRRISEQTAPMSAEIDRVRRSVALVREFHDRLVASVVTGAMDVRDASKEMAQVDASEDATVDGEDTALLAAEALVGDAEEVAT